MQRTILLAAITLVVGLVLYGPYVRLLGAFGMRVVHRARTDIDNSTFMALHGAKSGTPSMGGLLWLALLVAAGAAGAWSPAVGIALAGAAAFGLLGLADDVVKVLVKGGRMKRELLARHKLPLQVALALALGLAVVGVGRHTMPIGSATLDLGWGYALLVALAVLSTTNAVNITDGLDGLAGGLCVLALAAFLVIAWIGGQHNLAALCGAGIGGLLAFLWWNKHPARVFMGDVGALGLGALLAVLAAETSALLPLVIIGGVFAVETASSAAQMAALRRGRRIFKIAPLHHDLEARGWPETRVTYAFWAIGAVLAVVGVVVRWLGWL